MAQFTFDVGGEDTVITMTSDQFITLHGIKKFVGTHLVTFSGTATMQKGDVDKVIHNALQVDAEVTILSSCTMVVGPLWDSITQVSPIIAPSFYFNAASDEDDAQSWGLKIEPWETLDGGPHNKRIRINFFLRQNGQATMFSEINYQVTATGVLVTQD